MSEVAYGKWMTGLIEGADAHFSLGERPNVVRDMYRQLVADTILADDEAGTAGFSCGVSPESAGFFIDDLSRTLVSRPELANARFMALAVEWWRYARSYRELVERSPLLELENYLTRLSESHARVSWSDDVNLLVPWLDKGARGTPPIGDDHGVLTKRVVNRLLAIREATGGWLYGYIWGTYFLDDRQLKRVDTSGDPKSFLEEARRTRPSFEGC